MHMSAHACNGERGLWGMVWRATRCRGSASACLLGLNRVLVVRVERGHGRDAADQESKREKAQHIIGRSVGRSERWRVLSKAKSGTW